MRLAIAAAALGLLTITGCETSVDPFQESGYYFSIGGLLDAAVDTQFVRVSPLRRQAPVDPNPLTAEVESVDLTTGGTAIWQDSVFALQPSGFAHNYWSTFDFQPGREYRFSVRTPDGNKSTAVVALPDTFPDPIVQQPMFDPNATVNVYDIESLVDLRLLFCGQRNDGPVRRVDVSLLNRTSRFADGFTTVVNPYAVAADNEVGTVLWIRILAIAATADWPAFEEIDPETLALPRTVTNVENGVGYLGGAVSKIVNWPGFEPQHDDCVPLLRRW